MLHFWFSLVSSTIICRKDVMCSFYSEPEPQILDYITQQHKLFIAIASSHALEMTGAWLWKTFTKVLVDMRKGNVDNLPEVT